MDDKISSLTALCHRAVRCRCCFEKLEVSAPLIDIASPRWVGPKYWEANPRILILMLNPGSGDGRRDGKDAHFRNILHAFKNGSASLNDIFEHQVQDMPNWGNKGRFLKFYEEGLGLNLSDVAFGNIAWCPTKQNKYPSKMLARCFTTHTDSLIQILNPDVVLLSGKNTHHFEKDIQKPNRRIIKTLHYAHRKGRDAQQKELARVRTLLF